MNISKEELQKKIDSIMEEIPDCFKKREKLDLVIEKIYILLPEKMVKPLMIFRELTQDPNLYFEDNLDNRELYHKIFTIIMKKEGMYPYENKERKPEERTIDLSKFSSEDTISVVEGDSITFISSTKDFYSNRSLSEIIPGINSDSFPSCNILFNGFSSMFQIKGLADVLKDKEGLKRKGINIVFRCPKPKKSSLYYRNPIGGAIRKNNGTLNSAVEEEAKRSETVIELCKIMGRLGYDKENIDGFYGVDIDLLNKIF